MTPAEHYARAEQRLVDAVDVIREGRDGSRKEAADAIGAADRFIAMANVHAILATCRFATDETVSTVDLLASAHPDQGDR